MHQFETWKTAISIAPDDATVRDIIRKYVACLMPSDVAGLPLASQQALAHPDADIASAAVVLRHDELKAIGDSPVGELLHELAMTYTAASNRLAHLNSRGTMVRPLGDG